MTEDTKRYICGGLVGVGIVFCISSVLCFWIWMHYSTRYCNHCGKDMSRGINQILQENQNRAEIRNLENQTQEGDGDA